jgi:RNA polymerase sigma-70 factor (ECF subfamily)
MEALVASQERYVYSIALGVMKNPADAADMTQEAFIRLLRGLGTYRDDTKLTTWLYRLVVNVCLDELRRRKRPIESLEAVGARDDGEESLQVADADRWGQPEARLDVEESAAELHRAIDRLTDAQRLALTLHYFDDMPDSEIATVMGVPVNTVKSHLHRAKGRLFALLGGQAARPGRAPVVELRPAAAARVATASPLARPVAAAAVA